MIYEFKMIIQHNEDEDMFQLSTQRSDSTKCVVVKADLAEDGTTVLTDTCAIASDETADYSNIQFIFTYDELVEIVKAELEARFS